MESNTLTQETEIPEDGALNLTDQFVIFTIEKQKFALPVTAVSRIVHAVEITPIPNAPVNIIGVINVQGEPVPVFNMRKLFGLPAKELKLSDRIIFVRISNRVISFIADQVLDVTTKTKQKVITADNIFPGLEKTVEGLLFLEDGMILLYDPGKIFSLENGKKLDNVVKKARELGKKAKAKAEAKAKEKTTTRNS